jgi:DNA-binding transcriptional MerR regulator
MLQDYSIGELASRTGVKVPTIRYYEQIGLLDRPARTQGNQRRYDETALQRLRFVAHARDMGFPMPSVKTMLRIARYREAPCADLDKVVGERLVEVDARIAKLSALRSELAAMLADHHHGTVADCRVLEVLADHEVCGHEH